MNLRPVLFLVAITVAGAGCSQSGRGASAADKLVLTGSSTLAPLIAQIAKQYESEHPAVRIDVQTGGSSRGVADARSGLADLGMISRDLAPDESDLHAIPIAGDGVALIVHADNPVRGLTSEQVRNVYTGAIVDWSELGGKPGPITVVNKAEGRATLKVFASHLKLANSEIQAGVVVGDNEQGVKTVAGNPGSIGYVSVGTASIDIEHGVAIRMIALDGVTPSIATVRDGSYPVSRTLHLLTKGSVREEVAAFMRYVQSPEARPHFEAQRFVQLGGEV